MLLLLRYLLLIYTVEYLYEDAVNKKTNLRLVSSAIWLVFLWTFTCVCAQNSVTIIQVPKSGGLNLPKSSPPHPLCL